MPKTPDRLFVCPPSERMMVIHDQLKRRTFPNCRQLAKELEVCTPTVKRDLDFMKDRLRLPIEYDELHYGFHYTRPVNQCPEGPLVDR